MLEITNSDALYAYDLVKKICWEVGPGLPGSSQEWEWTDLLKGIGIAFGSWKCCG